MKLSQFMSRCVSVVFDMAQLIAEELPFLCGHPYLISRNSLPGFIFVDSSVILPEFLGQTVKQSNLNELADRELVPSS